MQGGTSLNSDDAFELCKAAFPPYQLPTIHSILTHWRQHAIAKGFDVRDGLLWKEGVRNAFTNGRATQLRQGARVR